MVSVNYSFSRVPDSTVRSLPHCPIIGFHFSGVSIPETMTFFAGASVSNLITNSRDQEKFAQLICWLNNMLIMIGVIVSAIVMTLLISVIGHLRSH